MSIAGLILAGDFASAELNRLVDTADQSDVEAVVSLTEHPNQPSGPVPRSPSR